MANLKKNNLLIVGATSGLMIACMKTFLDKKYNIFATYSKNKSLSNFPNHIRKSRNIKFIKLNLEDDDNKIKKVLKKNKIKADIIINAIGGTFQIKEYPNDLKNWRRSLNLNILKHILINNFFLNKMMSNKFGRILMFSSTAVEDTGAPITYSVSKALLENYVKKSSLLFARHNILINCIKTSIVAAKNNNWYKATISKPNVVKKIAKKI